MSGRTFEKFELIQRVLAHGRFVLHGSNLDDLRWIEPRPATGYGQGHRPSGVYATEDVASAIFYAVVDRKRVRWFTANRGVFLIEPVQGAAAAWVPGAVYVLDRGDLDLVDGNLVSTAAVKAVGKVAVSVEDFPLLAEVRHQTREAWLAERGAR
jgi:hypothetical protein